MDLVYILKPGENNTDLRYSLRSVFANVKSFDRIWFSGFKPSWVGDEAGLVTPYSDPLLEGSKWKNAMANVVAACRCPDVSSPFALMNDDFFAINPVSLDTDLNFSRGPLELNIRRFKYDLTSHWKKSFCQTRALLRKMGVQHFDDFALHMPMLIDKDDFLLMADRPEVRQHLREHAMLSYRSVYGNMFYKNPGAVDDCKIARHCDMPRKLAERQWISVFDNVTRNLELYPRLRKVLERFGRCRVECD